MTRSAPSAVQRAVFSGPPATAMTLAPAALASCIPAEPSPLAAECTTIVSPARSRPRRNRARCDAWNGSRNAAAPASSKPGGAAKTETASAMAYSAMPPSAILVMATTRWPSQASPPGPAASTTPQASMPSVYGGGVGTETSFPRHRSMSLKFSDAAPTLIRTSPAPGSGTGTSATCSTSPGGPFPVTRSAFTGSVADQAADVAAVAHVLVALVDVFQGVLPGDQLVQLELSLVVEVQQQGDVVMGVGGAVQRAADLLLHHGEHEQVAAELGVGGVADGGDDHLAALSHHVQRGADVVTLGDVGGDDEGIGHLAAGQQPDDRASLGHARRGVGSAELHRPLALGFHRVDRDDVPRPGDPGALDGVGADTADAHDHDGVARLDLGGAHGAAVAGGHAAADQRGLVERGAVVHLHHRLGRDHRVLGEGAEQAHLAEALAAGVEAVGAVELRAVDEEHAEVAQVVHAAGAVRAAAAGRQEAENHGVALGDVRDIGPDARHDAGPLVAADDRERHRDVAGDQVLVGVAQPARGELDQDLALLRGVELDFLDLPLLVQTPEHRGLGLH